MVKKNVIASALVTYFYPAAELSHQTLSHLKHTYETFLKRSLLQIYVYRRSFTEVMVDPR